MPAKARASGRACVMSCPAKTIVPVVGMVSPARQLKNVDLPAPFGPISPIMSPSSTARSAPRTARNSPNALETLVASSSTQSSPQIGRDSAPEIEQAAGLEARDQHDDAAVKNVGQPGAAAAEQAVGRGLQRNEDQRADRRAEQGAGAAEGCDNQHLHRDENAEAG